MLPLCSENSIFHTWILKHTKNTGFNKLSLVYMVISSYSILQACPAFSPILNGIWFCWSSTFYPFYSFCKFILLNSLTLFLFYSGFVWILWEFLCVLCMVSDNEIGFSLNCGVFLIIWKGFGLLRLILWESEK